MSDLIFTDFYGGSGRSEVSDGFYLVLPLFNGGSEARKSDGKNWVWMGGDFPDAQAAQSACERHRFGDTVTITASEWVLKEKGLI